jgi:hypothetical protein
MRRESHNWAGFGDLCGHDQPQLFVATVRRNKGARSAGAKGTRLMRQIPAGRHTGNKREG